MLRGFRSSLNAAALDDSSLLLATGIAPLATGKAPMSEGFSPGVSNRVADDGRDLLMRF